MSVRTIQYVALDGERLTFEVPKTANRPLIARAVKNISGGGDVDLAVACLTQSEQDTVLDIIAALEAHAPPIDV